MPFKTQACVFRFGPYESHAKSLELYNHGTKLKVRPQPLRLLNLLLSKPGEVFTREELRQELWSSETFVDFEHGLNSAVKAIRSALNDSVSEPRYVQTIPKVGYRLRAPQTRSERSDWRRRLCGKMRSRFTERTDRKAAVHDGS